MVYDSWTFRNGVNVFGYPDSIWVVNGNGFKMGGSLNAGEQHALRNNISCKGKGSDSFTSGSVEVTNSWNLSVNVSDADFVNLDTSLTTSPRDENGNDPRLGLFEFLEEETTRLVKRNPSSLLLKSTRRFDALGKTNRKAGKKVLFLH